jgi:Tfp pilus assembly protein PilV
MKISSAAVTGIARGVRDEAQGFSLVEALVSALFVALSVVAVVSAVSTGARLQVTDNDRRQARALLQSIFEEQYDFRNYNYITPGAPQTETVIIDERGGNALQGTLTRSILEIAPLTDNGTTFPAREVTLTCRWHVDEHTVDSVSLTKVVAQAKR